MDEIRRAYIQCCKDLIKGVINDNDFLDTLFIERYQKTEDYLIRTANTLEEDIQALPDVVQFRIRDLALKKRKRIGERYVTPYIVEEAHHNNFFYCFDICWKKKMNNLSIQNVVTLYQVICGMSRSFWNNYGEKMAKNLLAYAKDKLPHIEEEIQEFNKEWNADLEGNWKSWMNSYQ